MATILRPQGLTANLVLPLPLAGTVGAGALVALFFLALPAGPLESLVTASGVPAVLAAAEPPLGFTARIALALFFGGLVAGFVWLALDTVAADRMVDLSRLVPRRRPRTDPPRPPLSAARELGTPFLDVRASPAPTPIPAAERDLPRDLDAPLAAYDPAALRAVPLAPAEPLPPLARQDAEPEPPLPIPRCAPPAPEPIAPRPQLIDPGDRFETFELTPLARTAPPPPERTLPSLRAEPESAPVETVPPVVTATTEASVHDLLARLERGLSQRAAPRPAAAAPRSLAGTLGDLRRLATGADC